MGEGENHTLRGWEAREGIVPLSGTRVVDPSWRETASPMHTNLEGPTGGLCVACIHANVVAGSGGLRGCGADFSG